MSESLRDKNNYTKISISKDIHAIVKNICDAKGVKMYHVEDLAMMEYIEKNYPDFLKKENITNEKK